MSLKGLNDGTGSRLIIKKGSLLSRLSFYSKEKNMLELFIKILQLFADSQVAISSETKIGELDNILPFGKLDLLTAVLVIQVMHSVDVPDQLMESNDLTLEQFVEEVGKLHKQEDELFVSRTIKMYADLLGHRSVHWNMMQNAKMN